MQTEQLKERIQAIAAKREFLVTLLEEPNIGNLRIDVDQALEELDDLLTEFQQIFPEAASI